MKSSNEIKRINENIKLGSLNSSALNDIIIPLYAVMNERFKYDIEFIAIKRDQTRHTFRKDLEVIKSDFYFIEKEYADCIVQLMRLNNTIKKTSYVFVLKLIVKANSYFSSNKFKVGFNLSPQNNIDIFKYLHENSIDKGTLDRYISRFKTNIENSWKSYSQTHDLVKEELSHNCS
jgi:hypothetical protein